jgi:DNA-binding transcriptional LysR family regulator
MQIESLKVFCDLTETESFTKAAHINGVTQSAVSQQVSSLERQFKSLLIERSKKKFRLTREGQVLYESCKQIIQTYEALHNRLQEVKNIVSGTIRIAAIYSVGLHSLPPYIQKFLRAFPTVNVHIQYRRANQVYEDVLGNVVDMGLAACPVKDSRLHIEPMKQESLLMICHPNHVLAKKKVARVEQIAKEKMIAFEQDIPTRKAIDRVFRQHGVTIHPVMEFDNIETLKRAVEVEAGISIVPQTTVVDELKKRTLAAVPIEGADFHREVAIVYKRNKVVSPAMSQFIRLLKQPL